MPYNCRSGECAECRADLLCGEVEESPGADPAIFDDCDRARGCILACLCSPKSDVRLRLTLRDGVSAPTIEQVPACVARVDRVSRSVVQVELETAAPLVFRAGQYFKWRLPGVFPDRSFSAANRPGTRSVVFDVRLYAQGAVGAHVRDVLLPGDLTELIGPYGRFGFSPNDSRTALCIAGSTGLAPIKAMLGSEFAASSPRRIALFYGVQAAADLYDLQQLEAWSRASTNFCFHIALSDEEPASAWTGFRGNVVELVASEVADGFGYEAYLCGPPAMIDAAIPVMEDLGIEGGDVYFDRFRPVRTA